MPPTVSDVASVVSATASVGLFLIGFLSLLLAYIQLNNWKKQREHARISSIFDEVFDALTVMRSGYVGMLINEHSSNELQSRPIADRYEENSKAIAKLRPQVTALELLKVKQKNVASEQDVSEIINEAIGLWEAQRERYSKYTIWTEMLERPVSLIMTNSFCTVVERMQGTHRVTLPAEEKYYDRACSSKIVKSMVEAIERVAEIIRRHSAGEK